MRVSSAARVYRFMSLSPVNLLKKVVLTYRDIGAQQPSASEIKKAEQQINMLQNPDDKRGFAYEIFNIDADMEYYVVANEATSERYTVEVFEMPKVD